MRRERFISVFKAASASVLSPRKPLISRISFLSASGEKERTDMSFSRDSMGFTKNFEIFSNSESLRTRSKTSKVPERTNALLSVSRSRIHCIALSALWSNCAGKVS